LTVLATAAALLSMALIEAPTTRYSWFAHAALAMLTPVEFADQWRQTN
jgi:hypothetical protein